MRVFLSYAPSDEAFAKALSSQLTRRGFSVWSPGEEVLPGDKRLAPHRGSAEEFQSNDRSCFAGFHTLGKRPPRNRIRFGSAQLRRPLVSRAGSSDKRHPLAAPPIQAFRCQPESRKS